MAGSVPSGESPTTAWGIGARCTVARMTQINGTVADGFGAVADAFERNFTELGEVGAAFSLYVDGDAKVDIWAGEPADLDDVF